MFIYEISKIYLIVFICIFCVYVLHLILVLHESYVVCGELLILWAIFANSETWVHYLLLWSSTLLINYLKFLTYTRIIGLYGLFMTVTLHLPPDNVGEGIMF